MINGSFLKVIYKPLLVISVVSSYEGWRMMIIIVLLSVPLTQIMSVNEHRLVDSLRFKQ